MSLENNNENENDNNKKEKKSLYQVLDKQGFYIILLLCVGVIGFTAYWANNQQDDNKFIVEGPTSPFDVEEPEVTLVEEIEKKDTDQAQATGKIGTGKPDDTEKEFLSKEEMLNDGNIENAKNDIKKEDNKSQNEESKDRKIESKDEELKDKETLGSNIHMDEDYDITEPFAMPVVGKLGMSFAADHLVYHKTLDQWSTHKGIDIIASVGSPVKAVLDGEIIEVVNDTIMGITITIKHNDYFLTRYSNLSTDALVNVGERVEKGQTISGVGKTASVKNLEGALLHFQVLKGDKYVDPQIYLGKLNK